MDDVREEKRTEVICTKLTEKMAVHLLREASKDDRSVSEWLYLLIRRELYGRMGEPSNLPE